MELNECNCAHDTCDPCERARRALNGWIAISFSIHVHFAFDLNTLYFIIAVGFLYHLPIKSVVCELANGLGKMHWESIKSHKMPFYAPIQHNM